LSFEWLLVAAFAFVALILAVQWQRARAHAERAEIERRAAERARLADQAELRRQVAQSTALNLAQSDAVLIVAADRTLEQANVAALGLFGPKVNAGDTLMTATRSVELDELAAHVLAGGDDNDRQIMLNGLPFRARAIAAGEHGLALVLKDQSELQRLGRARRDFIANISHELRTPITSIRLLVESLLSGVANEAQARLTLLQKISTEVQALEQMAQELLDLAQIESGQAIVKLLPTPVNQLVSGAVERLMPQAQHKQQRIEMDVPPDLIALADADLINRTLGNLLHNAIKFTPPGGRIQVQARAANGDVLVSVADSGPGIAPMDLPRVFERFYRGDRSRKSGGTGLGLAIAKHVVEAHGGKIWVESDGVPGHGACFSFTLLAAEPGHTEPHMTNSTQRVLFLCTHNSARSQMAEGLLRSLSHNTVAAFSAGTVATRVRPEAIAVMHELGIDVTGQTSKTLERFVNEPFDVVITVCDSANETCPFFPQGRARWHWSIADPSQVQGTDEERRAAFRAARDDLRRRIESELLPYLHGEALPPHPGEKSTSFTSGMTNT
jgi:two-component system phosphate regulon sensor histidine kinase PhoR